MNNKLERYKNRQKKRQAKRKIDKIEYDNYNMVFTYDHLLEAAKKCKHNVNWKSSVQNFMRELHYNVFAIYTELRDKKFKIKSSYEFDIFERGKKRHIRSVHIRERVVQRCLCDNCLIPILSKTFIYDNCASLKDKGTNFALKRLKHHMLQHYRKYGLDGYVLLFDFSDYFASIPHDKIMGLFAKYITDKDILNLIQLFVDMDGDERGLCLGNQVSQVGALLMASPLDHYIKDKCRVKHYIRYMDDGIIIHHSKEFLIDLLEDLNKIANDLGLTINMKKTKIVKFSSQFKFLKKKIRIDENGRIYMRIIRSSITRMRRKLKKLRVKLDNGEITFQDVITAYQSWHNYALKYNSYNSVCSMDKLFFELYEDILVSM